MTTRRSIHPQIRVLDSKRGLVEYVASDETVDSYREVIRADGWLFDDFSKNSPFVDSHNYGSINSLLGKVVDFKVSGKRLIETVQWAVEIAEQPLAQLGFRMTEGGYLKAVSVGFTPVKMVSKWDRDTTAYQQQIIDLKIDASAVSLIYLQQQQKELSACVIGANPNAVAKAYKAGLLTDSDLEHFRPPQSPEVRSDDSGYLAHLRRIAAQF